VQRLVRPHLTAGDALLFDCRILHFGLANQSNCLSIPLHSLATSSSSSSESPFDSADSDYLTAAAQAYRTALKVAQQRASLGSSDSHMATNSASVPASVPVPASASASVPVPASLPKGIAPAISATIDGIDVDRSMIYNDRKDIEVEVEVVSDIATSTKSPLNSSGSSGSGSSDSTDSGTKIEGYIRPMIYVNYHHEWFRDPKNWNDNERLFE